MVIVSVIIPIRHREDISGVIKSLEESTYRALEVIVVDEGKERSAQRNSGIAKAKGKYLLILDSDQRVHPDTISECAVIMEEHPEVGGIYIPEKLMTRGLFARIRDWERQFYTGTAIDVVRFVRRENCPLFDLEMSGPEDTDWDRHIKGARTTSFYPFYHYERVNIITYFRKKAYYTKSMARFIEQNPDDKILDFKWRCWTVFTEHGKWRRFFGNPLMAIAVMFLLLARGIIYKVNR